MNKKEQKIFSRPRIKLPNINFTGVKNNNNIRKISTIIAILSIAIIVLRVAINATIPIIDEQCKNMARSIATKVSNEQATKVMADYTYEDLFRVVKDDENNIKMISADMITINKIISDIPILMQEELEKEENNTFTLKLRQFFGKQIFCRNGTRYKNKDDDRWQCVNRFKIRIYRSGN